MKKRIITLLVIAIVSFFIGFYIDFQKPGTVREDVDNRTDKDDTTKFFDYKENNLDELVSVNPQNIDSVRKKLTKIVFGTSYIPQLLPDTVYEIEDSLYSDISNLKYIKQFEIVQKYNVQSKGYIFKPKTDNHRLFIYHQGHNGDFYLGKRVIEYFVNKGFSVYAFSMPLFGKNNDPVVTVPNIGTFRLTDDEMESHELMKFLDNPISFFVAPVIIMINYAQSENYKDVAMCGISGGGWTTTIVSALESRVNYSFPVAGTYPMYIKLNSPSNSYGDFEQVYPPLYKNVSYLDMYILAATGKNRFQVQMLNMHDPCCFQGTYYKDYEQFVKLKVKEFDSGLFDVISDSAGYEHKVSEFFIEKIYNRLAAVADN